MFKNDSLDKFRKNILDRKYIILVFTIVFVCFFLMLIKASGPYSVKEFLVKNSFGGCIILTLAYFFSIVSIICYDFSKIHLFTFFFLAIFGLLTTFVTPILDTPDEPTHFNRAELTSRLNLIPEASSGTTYEVLSSVIDLQRANKLSIIDTNEDEEDIIFEYENVSLNAATGNVFIGYVFSAIGVNIAKTLNLKVIWMLWLGRACNAIIAALICSFALWITPKFKLQFLIIMALPMSIYLSASVGIDGLINSFAFLTIAFFLRLLLSDEYEIDAKGIVGFTLSAILSGILKLPYFALILLLMCIPKRKFSFDRNILFRVAIISVCFCMALGWYYVSTKIYAPPNNQSVYLIEKNINALEQVKYIFRNPVEALNTLFGSIFNEFSLRCEGFFIFGWLEYGIQNILPLYLVFFGASMIMYPMDIKLNWKERSWIVFVSALIIVAMYLILYIAWTPVGGGAVEGIQSRYFIPLLLLIPIGLYLNTDSLQNKLDLFCISALPFFITAMLVQTIIVKY